MRKILIMILISFLLVGCNNYQIKNEKIKLPDDYEPEHYIISLETTTSSSGNSAYLKQYLEIENKKIISGNLTTKECITYYYNKTPHCNYKFEELNYLTLKNKVDERYELIKHFNKSRVLYWDEKDFIKIYEEKKGCKFNLCYDNQIITEFSVGNGGPTGLEVWKIKNIK